VICPVNIAVPVQSGLYCSIYIFNELKNSTHATATKIAYFSFWPKNKDTPTINLNLLSIYAGYRTAVLRSASAATARYPTRNHLNRRYFVTQDQLWGLLL